MKDLSVIIVNYNVEYFLEQCLLSVRAALKEIDGEVIVVDNASVDGSLEMLAARFPEVHVIANKENTGFSRANNQGIHISEGRYVLLLNPDTIVEEDTFLKCVQTMDSDEVIGGLGVKMLDGSGRFLPESKRGLPTPEVALYKVTGLSSLFPRSRRFGRYHLGFLDENEDHDVDVLSGAFMFLRKSALDKVGLLDEEFFMYGEDVDLSYRITLGGYRNRYLSSGRIVHYKGESTKKGSLNYVMVFYNAMRIFARKHFSQKQAKAYSGFIELAIYARAGVSIIKRLFQALWHPLLDGILLWIGLEASAQLYSSQTGIELPEDLKVWALPLYSIIWVFSGYWSSSYDRPFKARPVILGVVNGAVLILILYALLPEEFRFSRFITLAGSFIATAVFALTRTVIHRFSGRANRASGRDRRFVVVGGEEERKRISSMMEGLGIPIEHIHEADVRQDVNDSLRYLRELVQVMDIHEVVFCAKDMKAQAIIEHMSALDQDQVEFKIAPPESMFIIGSNDRNDNGDLLGFQMNAITKRSNQRNKRSLDILLALLFIALSPILILWQKERATYLKNALQVLIGKASWVGYHPADQDHVRLPEISTGVLYPGMDKSMDSEQAHRINLIYAKDYSLNKDLDIIFTHWRWLGRQSS